MSESGSTNYEDSEDFELDGVDAQFQWEQAESAYAAKHFGFTAKSFSNGVYNAVNSYIAEGLEAVRTYMDTEYGEVITPSQVDEGMQKMKTHIAPKVDSAFDTLESYLVRNIFCVPENSVLTEDKIQVEKPVTEDEKKQMEEKIEELTEEILAVKLANAHLQSVIKEIDGTQTQLLELLQQVQSMNNIFKEAGVSDIGDSLTHASSQIRKRIQVLQAINTSKSGEGNAFSQAQNSDAGNTSS